MQISQGLIFQATITLNLHVSSSLHGAQATQTLQPECFEVKHPRCQKLKELALSKGCKQTYRQTRLHSIDVRSCSIAVQDVESCLTTDKVLNPLPQQQSMGQGTQHIWNQMQTITWSAVRRAARKSLYTHSGKREKETPETKTEWGSGEPRAETSEKKGLGDGKEIKVEKSEERERGEIERERERERGERRDWEMKRYSDISLHLYMYMWIERDGDAEKDKDGDKRDTRNKHWEGDETERWKCESERDANETDRERERETERIWVWEWEPRRQKREREKKKKRSIEWWVRLHGWRWE